MRDGLELKYVFEAISNFIKDIREPLENLINTITDMISGEKLGKDVGSFYSNLVSNGLPEDLAKEMTKEYFESRIAIFKSLSNIVGSLEGFRRHEGGKNLVEALKGLKELSKEEEEEED